MQCSHYGHESAFSPAGAYLLDKRASYPKKAATSYAACNNGGSNLCSDTSGDAHDLI
jgi:hypothetical protein